MDDMALTLLQEFAHGNGVRVSVVMLHRSPDEVDALRMLALHGMLTIRGDRMRITHNGKIYLGEADKGP